MRKRSTDRGWHRLVRENWYRDVWLLIITILVAFALNAQSGTLSRIQEGRRQAVAVTCAVVSAISQAGRDVIISGARAPETQFARNLERMGYPPRPVRISQADAAAAAYVNGIVRRIAGVTSGSEQRLVRPDGTIDCRAFLNLARTR